MWSSFSVTVILEDPSDSSWTGTLSPPHLPLQWRTCSKYRVPGSVDSVWRATTQMNMLYQPSKVIWMEVCQVFCPLFFNSVMTRFNLHMLCWQGMCLLFYYHVYWYYFVNKRKKNNHREDMNFTKHQNILLSIILWVYVCFCHKARKKLNFRGSREDIFIY